MSDSESLAISSVKHWPRRYPRSAFDETRALAASVEDVCGVAMWRCTRRCGGARTHSLVKIGRAALERQSHGLKCASAGE
jgi:hypothetical protein